MVFRNGWVLDCLTFGFLKNLDQQLNYGQYYKIFQFNYEFNLIDTGSFKHTYENN